MMYSPFMAQIKLWCFLEILFFLQINFHIFFPPSQDTFDATSTTVNTCSIEETPIRKPETAKPEVTKPEEQNSAKKQEKSVNAEQKPEAAKTEEPKPKKKPLPAKPWLKKKKPVVKKVGIVVNGGYPPV